ncbi:MAG: DUF4192 domain-containing protein [Actinobacteria bacterium]|nr:DUF4192 domain-containing protein [Actinomycetota bacterium]
MTNCHIDLTERPTSAVFLNGPADLVSAVPYLLGFTPTNCIVAAFLSGTDGELILTARVDHPHPGQHESFVAAWQQACEGIVNSNDVDRLVLVDFCTQSTFGECVLDADVATSSGESAADFDGVRNITNAMAAAAASLGLYTCDEVMVIAHCWRSVLCRDERCCPTQGQPIDPERGARVAAPFVAEGVAPLASRESIGQRITPVSSEDPRGREFQSAVTQSAAHFGECADIPSRRALVMDSVAALTTGATEGTPLAVACIQDLRRRDALLRILIQDVADEPRRIAEDALVSALTLCAHSHRAAVATVVAGLAWQRGDGALAQECLDLALASDESYSLARLLTRAIRHAVPPTVWVDAVAATTVESCLIGS